jgi:hypothetical protein
VELSILAASCHFLLGLAFFLAGFRKIVRSPAFRRALLTYSFAPSVRQSLMVALPPLELVVGALILAGIALPVVLITSGVLLVLFSIAVVGFRQAQTEDCGCFGRLFDPHSKPKLLLRNLLLLAAVALALSVDTSVDEWPVYSAIAFLGIAAVFLSPLVRHLLLSSRQVVMPMGRNG